ncbi:dihydrofolate reductase family protein [Chitinophaga qingshengii]|uniref:Dihydrofolate reductase n=1 Tax=Chitinophaga qingshengii TaxID=1569794 RepID=A0ABR7TP49_9BACT|nr:dihydrofolate reductase family protein [Chitinophaga qingshengii]MBC9932251.1 dihydrofolate reductase [Chitinophaga qingshengii]
MKRKVNLYIAISLDGYIADENGQLEWLTGLPNPEKTDYGFADFFATTDTTLLGYKTYAHILELADTYPHPNHANYVFTRSERPAAPHVTFVHGEDIPGFVQQLKAQPGKDIWLIGGGELNAVMLEHDLIDHITLHIMPVALGKGRPLFADKAFEKQFTVEGTKMYQSGAIETMMTITPAE